MAIIQADQILLRYSFRKLHTWYTIATQKAQIATQMFSIHFLLCMY